MKSEIVMIPTEKLLPHPDNPRKDVGDVSELAASIKEVGIMQNLTVVPWFDENMNVSDEDKKYRVIIGHRRLAAAKEAGIDALPCAVVNMTPKEQISVMLLENMQRKDLTLYEEAQGMQMMMDFGDSADDIAKSTGLSKSTVYRRVRLCELDADTLRSIPRDRQINISDFDRLFKIENAEKRNEILRDIGTSNFDYNLRREISAQNERKKMDEMREKVSAFATETGGIPAHYAEYHSFYTPADIDRFEPDTEAEYVFKMGYSCICLYRLSGAEEEEKIDAEREREEREMKNKELSARLNAATERAYEARRLFAVKHIPKKGEFARLALELLNSGSADMDDICALHGISDEEDDNAKDNFILSFYADKPEKFLFDMIYCSFYDGKMKGYYNYTRYYENISLNEIYEFLAEQGYEMSDEEKALRTGEFREKQKKELGIGE